MTMQSQASQAQSGQAPVAGQARTGHSQDSTEQRPSAQPTGRPAGMWGRALRRIAGQDPASRPAPGPSTDQVRAHQCSPVGQAAPRTRVQLLGTVQQVSMVERPGHQWLEATIADCSGTITLVWMAQNAIKGLQAGRTVRVRGRVATDGGRPVIYNPEYELLA